MFEFSSDYQFEAIGDERPNVVIPDPAPRCKLAIRKDTGDWFVATGVYFKPVSTEDGTIFRDVDGGIWRFIVMIPRTPPAAPQPVEAVAVKPFMYGIQCPDGSAYFEEYCVDRDEGALQEVIEEQELEGHTVVPLYAAPQPVLSQPEVKALTDWERTRLLQYAAVNALNYMGHHANGGLKPDEIEDMDRWKTLSDKLKALCPLSDIPAQAGEVLPIGNNHPDALAVDRFAAAMKAKLAMKRAEGRGGWENPDECSIAFLSELLRDHVSKGDPVDVGNLAMMIHQRGGAIE